MRGAGWTVLAVGLCLGAARGEQEQEGRVGAELVLRTQALEARRSGEWRAALLACAALRQRGPLDLSLELLAAEAHLALAEHAAAGEALDRVLLARPDHAQALFLRARVAEHQGDREATRAWLVRAARAGRPILSDIGHDGRSFGWVLREPPTVLAIMTAAQAYELPPPEARRDPFARPRPARPGEPPPPPPSLEVQELEREALALLAELDRELLLEEPDLQRLLGRIDRLAAVVERHAGLPGADPARLRERLGAWAQRHGAPGDLRQRVWLRLLIREGNRALLAMRDDLEAERFQGVRERLLLLEDLAARLRALPLTEGARLAEALLLRGRALEDEARARERLARLPLEVTGIVLPPPAEPGAVAEPASAIVDDRVVRVGEELPLDEEGGDGLRVVAIGAGSVRFRWRGVELTRHLKARPAK